jgi:hypothetical protein
LPGAAGVRLFGMGFVSDAPGSQKEKLYIAGADDNHSLGVIDTEKVSPRPKIVASITSGAQNPELTGTADAKLYAFYPNTFEPAFVQEVDKATGELRGTRWTLGDQGLGTVGAWAFAQWGGKFFIFVTAEGDSTVRMIDRTTGKYSVVMTHLPYRISGAGVSTCAPERDQ